MVRFAVESIANVIEEIKPLLTLHWEEIAGYKDSIPLDPDYEKYETMAQQGRLVIVTARDAGKLIGYSIFFLVNHMHYKSTLFAVNDVIFMLAEYRKGMAGVKLIKLSEVATKSVGAIKISWHLKPDHDFRPILERLGYKMDEYSMGKLL